MRKFYPLVFFLMTAFAVSGCRSATQKAIEEFGIVSTEDLSQGIQEKTLFVFDANSPESYKKHHIPTAAYLSYRDPDPAVLPSDKNALLVFYCKNERCTASHEAARFAREQGYQNLKIYPLGIDGWVKAGMTVESGIP